jgi:hypothetical protein
MRTTARLLAGVAALLTALGGAGEGIAGAGMAAQRAAAYSGAHSAGPHSFGPHWAAASKATVHPGVRVTIAGVQCIAGFVLTDGTHVYLGVPASCTGVSDGQPTDGCTEAQVPPGVPATIAGARHNGTLVYSSFTTMQLHGETQAARCQNNSLSLVRLDRRDIMRTNPSVPLLGGPAGVSRAQPAVPDRLMVLLSAPTNAEAIATGAGGWAHTMMIDGEVNKLTVGSPALTADGKALGMVSVIPTQGGPGQTSVGDLYRELQALRHIHRFRHVWLAKGTEPYAPPALAAA